MGVCGGVAYHVTRSADSHVQRVVCFQAVSVALARVGHVMINVATERFSICDKNKKDGMLEKLDTG